MKTHILLSLFLAAATNTIFAQKPTNRYTVVTHSVNIDQIENSIPVLFKLDSVGGSIWRLAGSTFVQIPVENTWTASIIENQAAYVEEIRERDAFRQRLSQIIIPQVEFRQANLHDVITFLHDESLKHDPKGISMILRIPPVSRMSWDPTPTAREPNDPDQHNQYEITFGAIDISLLDTLNVVMDVAGLKWRYSNGSVIIGLNYTEGKHAKRLYELLPSTIDRIHSYHQELIEPESSAHILNERWQEFFSEYGVSWPRHSSIRPLPLIGRMLVTNTPDNLQIIDGVIEGINTHPAQAGRFQLIHGHGKDRQMLILLDSQIGHTWQYEITEYDPDSREIQSDSFSYIAH